MCHYTHFTTEEREKSIVLKAQGLSENCNIKCHQRFGERFSGSDASKGESHASFFLG